MADLYIALDVGGTFIKAGIIDQNGIIKNNSITKYDAKSKQNSNIILTNFIDIFKAEISKASLKNSLIRGIGFAFPGPFDYDNGVCLISGIDKYESIYGMNIRNELKGIISKDKLLTIVLDKNYEMVFENDAALFALGEYNTGKAKGFKRIICIAIGTGCGSAFIDNGVIIKGRHDVPRDGVLYHLNYKNSIVDDYVSARGIVQTYRMQNGRDYHSDIKSMADEARQGDPACRKVFYTLGDMLGEVLLPHLEIYSPDCIVLGGQISKSYDLFKDSLHHRINSYNVPVLVSDDTSASTLSGIADIFAQRSL